MVSGLWAVFVRCGRRADGAGCGACSRVCSSQTGIVRKYHIFMCRQCFRDQAELIGFRKVRRISSPCLRCWSFGSIHAPRCLPTPSCGERGRGAGRRGGDGLASRRETPLPPPARIALLWLF